MWNGDRASDGLVHSIPENLSVFILALRISLEILHTHTHSAIPYLPKMNPTLYIDSNLVSRSLFLFLFPSSNRRTSFNFKFCSSSFFLLARNARCSISKDTRRYLIVSRRLCGVHERINGDRYSRPIYREIIKLEKS